MNVLLELRDVCKRFGALVVNERVSLSVQPGEVHALIGPNGAGKSCLIGAITGELPNDSGEIRFNGERIDRVPVERRARLGIVRAYQVPQFFGSLSVRANVAIAQIARNRSAWRLWRSAAADQKLQAMALESLRQMELEANAARPSASLGHGEKRQLELAMSFAAQPELLLLDEPLAGLGAGDRERMIERLRALKGRYAMLLVEHDMEAVFSLADRISVLVTGRIIASGSAAEIRSHRDVRAAYLGEETQ